MTKLAPLIFLALLLPGRGAQAPASAPGNRPTSTTSSNEDPLGRETPYGCVKGFLKYANRGDYARAGEYLDVPVMSSRADELARQLGVVVDLGLSGNLSGLSRSPEGDLGDGLSVGRERVGFVRTSSGTLDILLDRVQQNGKPPIWLFSSETLQRVPATFEEIDSGSLGRFFPPLFQMRFLSVPLWRWLAIIIGLALSLAGASLVTRALMILLRSLVRRMTGADDDGRLSGLRAPVRLVILAIAIRIIASFSASLLSREFWTRVAEILAIVGVAWLVMKFSNILSDLGSRHLSRKQAPDKIALLVLAHRLFKVLVLLAVALLLLRSVGINVTAMLAGLGVGGIALAFAAQKTLENFFGGINVTMRDVIRVGDVCRIADQTGTIEDIRLGSIRIRTPDRTVVSVSNSQVSQTSLENYSMRDKFWFHHVFGLRHDTSPQQMRSVVTELDKFLRKEPKIERETVRIRFIGFSRSSLDVDVFAYIQEKDYPSFLCTQEDLLLKMMDVLASNGTSIALPSQVTYIDRDQRDQLGRGEERVPAFRGPDHESESREILGAAERANPHSIPQL